MIEAENTLGQVVTLLILVAFLAAWVVVALRRERVRDRKRLSRLAKVSGPRPTVAATTKDRSGT